MRLEATLADPLTEPRYAHTSTHTSLPSLVAFNDFLLMLGRRNGSTSFGIDYLLPGGGLAPTAPFAPDVRDAFATGRYPAPPNHSKQTPC